MNFSKNIHRHHSSANIAREKMSIIGHQYVTFISRFCLIILGANSATLMAFDLTVPISGFLEAAMI